MGWTGGWGGGGLRCPGRACGGTGAPERSGAPALALIEIVLGKGFGIGGIEPRALVEVVEEGFLCDLVVFPTVGLHGEFGLGWSPGWMEEWGRGGLADVGQNLGNGLRIGEEGNEGEGALTGWADEGEDLIDSSQEGGPSGRPGRGGVGWLGRNSFST